MQNNHSLRSHPELCREIAALIRQLLEEHSRSRARRALAKRIQSMLSLLGFGSTLLYEYVELFGSGHLSPSHLDMLRRWVNDVLSGGDC